MRFQRARCGRRDAAGYTLLEVIVAFGVLALALTLLLGILTNSSRQVRWSSETGRAAMLAQSVLDQVDMEGALKDGERDGAFEDGRYRWHLKVARWRDPAPAQAPVPGAPIVAAPQLYAVDLSMLWGEGGPREQLALHSLRLQQAGLDAQ